MSVTNLREAQEQQQQQPSRRLAAIMFTDLVGYSAMAQRDEALAIELLELHRNWVRAMLSRYGGREIETVGDAFLIEFAGALGAVEFAIAVQERFAEYNRHAPPNRRMKLRIGVHLCDVEHRGDKVMGDGVNLASRIHGMAEPGGICVSEDVQRAVRAVPGLRFVSLGKPKLKNIDAQFELFRVQLSRGRGDRGAAMLSGARRWFDKVPRWLKIAVVVIVLINVFGDDDTVEIDGPDKEAIKEAIRADLRGVPRPPGVPVLDDEDAPAIAVLPFANLSSEADSAFFTDGLHDTVIGHLSRLSGLKVISRTSVMRYRDKQDKSLRRIGRELHVDHILEGSVQRAGNRLRVVAQLIEADTDTHVWSQEYDRDLKDVFAVQADIAKNVAAAVHAKLTPQEQASIAAVPTANPEAHDLYLKALLIERRADPKPEEVEEAIRWVDRAVALDPKFAPGYALLAYLHDKMYWGGMDPTAVRRELVQKSADTALKLDPKLAEAHLGKALYHYHGSRNYEAALAELEIARGLAPSNARVSFWIGTIYRRQGRWDAALESMGRAATLDPLNTGYLVEHAGTLTMTRRYKESVEAFDRVVELEKDNPIMPIAAANNRFVATGDLAPLEQALAKMPKGFDPVCQVSGARVGLALLKHKFDEAIAAGNACTIDTVPASGGERIPIDYFRAQVKWLAGGRKPLPEAAKVRDFLEKELAARPDLADSRMKLALTFVMLGDSKRAVAEAERAVADMPVSRDALTGAGLRRIAIEVYANSGMTTRAIEELEDVLELPAGGHAQEIRRDPMLMPLNADPRFQKLVEKHLAKAGA